MSRFSNIRSRICQFLAVSFMASAFTGCCITPLNNDCSGSNYRSFMGFTLKPGETIQVQAQGGDRRLFDEDRWETIGTLTTDSEEPIPGFNMLNYYLFSGLVRIPETCWDEVNRYDVSLVRLVDSSGMVLYTMSKNFDKGFEGGTITDFSPLEIWLENGNHEGHLTFYRH